MSVLADLKLVLSADEYVAISNLPETLLKPIWESKQTELDELRKAEASKEAKLEYYKAGVLEQVDMDADQEQSVLKLKRLLQVAGFKNDTNGDIFLSLNKRPDGTRIKKVSIQSSAIASYLCSLIEQDKERIDKVWDSKQSKKKPSKATGKRNAFKGEKRYVNKVDEPEGKDNEFYFKGDETATFEKPTFTANDGSYQNITYKAVKSKRYLGGAESKADDGICCGVCAWDRAKGSEALASLKMSYAQFKVRCDGKADANGFCSKCNKQDAPLNFFEDKYNFTKGMSKVHNGLSYKDFIVQKLEYA
jgi:peptidoglycan hydrolase-like protein with peptidoglycan-binding domain